jgi:LCP family protein required for cell wall assembly
LLANQRRFRREKAPVETRPPRRRLRGVRGSALAIIAVVPLTLGAWALSIAVPTAYQAWRAWDEVFQPRAERPRLADQAPAAPTSMPESVQALLTATAEGTPASALTTAIPASGAGDASPTATFSGVTDPTVSRGATDRAQATAEALQATRGPSPTPYPDWNGDDPVHILLLGVDTRPSETSPGRSDTMIVVRIDPEAERVDMFSIPRDLAVNIPGFSNGVKINSAFPWGESYEVEGGGPGLVASTIEINFGIVIDYYATVDIPGLEKIVDTLGGVIVDADAQLKDDQYPTDDYRYTRAFFPPGLQKLDGEHAVQYARTRHADGDFKRAERQQQVLIAIRDQALESGIVSNLADLIADLRNTVRTDLSPEQVYALANLARDIPRENIWVHSLAPYMSASNTDQGWFLIGDWDALRWITQNLTEDPLATNMPGG